MSYLARIIERKRQQVREGASTIQLASLQRDATPCTTDVVSALKRSGTLQFIAEHKRKSPSRGFIRKDSDPAEIGLQYESAGAAAMSVLTDDVDFAGSPQDLQKARAAISIPILCKDFIVSPVQVFQARAWGADLVLLIVAALSRAELQSLHHLATGLGMTPLVEVHDAHELDVAASIGAKVIGVNNRNLHTFTVDLSVSEELVNRFPANVVRVSESGIDSVDDLKRLHQAGFDAVLMGERLMRTPHPGQALSALREAL